MEIRIYTIQGYPYENKKQNGRGWNGDDVAYTIDQRNDQCLVKVEWIGSGR